MFFFSKYRRTCVLNSLIAKILLKALTRNIIFLMTQFPDYFKNTHHTYISYDVKALKTLTSSNRIE